MADRVVNPRVAAEPTQVVRAANLKPWSRSLRLQGYDYSKPGCYFLSLCCRNKNPLFAERKYADVTWNYLKERFKSNNGCIIAVVLMTDHLHLIIEFSESSEITVGRFLMDLKLSIWRALKKEGMRVRKIWQRNYYEHIIRNDKDLQEKIQYIVNNPVKSNLVEQSRDWKYCWHQWME